ncbi:hypothetical protein ACL9RI_06585 [Janthinobacterium sp. Mn2066]|uniref:hypothetical protein n=1 Tax=Janthinobacterium sp. Mn2066 TaxID=3395264 RepID=UPI003BE6DAB8
MTTENARIGIPALSAKKRKTSCPFSKLSDYRAFTDPAKQNFDVWIQRWQGVANGAEATKGEQYC